MNKTGYNNAYLSMLRTAGMQTVGCKPLSGKAARRPALRTSSLRSHVQQCYGLPQTRACSQHGLHTMGVDLLETLSRDSKTAQPSKSQALSS